MKEWHRTVILVFFLMLAITIIIVVRRLSDANLG